MPCIDPPALTPDQLSAALDGMAEAAVTEHLARCADCAERLEAARALEQRLSSRLHRWDCPTPQQLVDLHLGLLDEGGGTVGEHAAGCARCQAELADLRNFLAAGTPATAPTPARQAPRRPSVRELVAQWLPQAPALALRGERLGPRVAQAGDVMLVVEIQPAAESELIIVGQLAAPEQEQWTGALAQIWLAETVAQTALVDEMGGFRFEGLAPARVELRITPPTGPAIVLPGLELGGKARDG